MKISEFKEKTDRLLNRAQLMDMTPEEIENSVTADVERILSEQGIDAKITGTAIYGSRSRGLEVTPSADLDVVVEVESELKEYAIYNAIHSENITINDVIVDVNPIRAEETGTLESYLEAADEYLSGKARDRAMGYITDFLAKEYSSTADFSDLSKINIAYTESEEQLNGGYLDIQVSVDLINHRIYKQLGNFEVSSESFASVEDMLPALADPSFDELTSLSEEEIAAYIESRTYHSEQIEGLTIRAYDDGSGSANLNGTRIGGYDILAQEAELGNTGGFHLEGSGKAFVEQFMEMAEVYAVRELGAKRINTAAAHQEQSEKETTVINILGGAGIGKSTCSMAVTAELKKRGYQADYVQEVAKELVYAGDMEHLDGSLKNQAYIMAQQKQRLDLLTGQVDYAVTDSPLLLNVIYLKEHNADYEQEVLREFGTYRNINIVLGRDLAVEYQNEGRIHTLEESLVKDKEIVELLEKNNIPFKSFERSDINGIIRYVTDTVRDQESKLTLSQDEVAEIAQKIQQNEIENNSFRQQLNSFISLERNSSSSLIIGKTPYSLSLGGATYDYDLIIAPRTLLKCMSDSDERYHGHGLSSEIVEQLPNELRCPVMLFKGSVDNSLVAFTSLKDSNGDNVIVSIKPNDIDKHNTVNRVTSAYGKHNTANYVSNQLNSGNLIALNTNKANDMFQSLGLQSPPEETFISFDNSIAYSLANVKYPKVKKIDNERIVIDTETTGLSPFGGDELLQVSIINDKGTVLYNEYVKPTAHESWERAMAVNHITPEMVADKQTIQEQLAAINAITSTAKEVIGYNTQFDINFLSEAGVNFSDDCKVSDVMADYSERHGVWNNNTGKYNWIKLVECAEHYGYDWNSNEGQAHNSVSDCFATLHCYNELQKEIEREREEQQAREAQQTEKQAVTLQNDKVRIFVDMDGTLARFHDEVRYLERMWEEGFFEQLKPFQEMVDSIKLLKKHNPNAEIFILSAAIEGEPPYCKRQKHEWLDRYLPEIDKEHRIFTDIGVPKADYIKGGVKKTDILIDDYNKGLEEWEQFGGTSVKCHNNINHKGLIGKLWEGEIIHNFEAPEKICKDIVAIANSLPDPIDPVAALKRTAAPKKHKEQEQPHRKI